MKSAVKYIEKAMPLAFILENVRGFVTAHRSVKRKLMKRLLKIKKYILHETNLNSRNVGGIQTDSGGTWLVTISNLPKIWIVFKWPAGRGPKITTHVLDTKSKDVLATSFNKTIQRNWSL